ncbi:MAG: hypothetical protein JWM95_559 [Gemmatimonadetes bacterium]|nr:hypothetical protein [Gemmatimonadota bacterium]
MSEHVEGKQVDGYHCYLKEPHRPPSRGGNTRALHQHVLEIEDAKYSFLALGSQKWVFKTDRVSFEYERKGPYRNIVKSSIETVDKNGRAVVRGNRDLKTQLRTTPSRLPASRREQRD